MVSRAANVIIRAIRLAPIAVCLLSVCPELRHSAWAQAVENATPAAASPAAAPSPSPAPTPDAKRVAEDACKAAVTKLGAGDPAALTSLAAEKQTALRQGGRLAQVCSCLAVADDNRSYCDLLSAAEKDACVSDWQVISKLKALPKGAQAQPLVTSRLFEQCKSAFEPALCNQFQEAMATSNAAKCKGLPQAMSVLCDAVVSGDASRCPKEGDDCNRTVALIAKVKKEGLEGFRGNGDQEVFVKAARDGKPACAPLLASLQENCIQGTQ